MYQIYNNCYSLAHVWAACGRAVNFHIKDKGRCQSKRVAL